ncbi:uncharacterized protein LOC114857830 isoform X2 [Betta splendens]|nr:uncharacterized protein LOC114857830 isoform X2 [Betta splendens]
MDYPDAQDPQFKGRTALSHEDLSSGVMTLQIVSVQLGDSGIYSCNVPNVGDSVLSQCVMLTVTNTTEVRPTTTRSQEEDERTKSEVDNTVGAVVWVCVLVGVLVGAGLLFLVKRRKSLRCWRKVRKAPAVEGAIICHMQTLMKPSGAGDQNQDVTQITLSNK